MDELNRRGAVKAAAVGAVAFGGAVALGQDKKGKTTRNPYRIAMEWGTVKDVNTTIEKNIRFAEREPGRRNAVGFIFSESTLAIGPGDEAFNASALISFSVPVSLPEELPEDYDGTAIDTTFIGYNHFVRGTIVRKDKDARIVIIADAAGTTRVFEFPYDIEIGDAAGTQIDPDIILNFFSPMNVAPVESDPRKYPTLPPYAVKLLVSVERRSKEAEANIAIDSLDIQATYSAPDKTVSRS